jgi:hypothetical protein
VPHRHVIALTGEADPHLQYLLPHVQVPGVQVTIVDPLRIASGIALRIGASPTGGIDITYDGRLLTADLENARVYFGQPKFDSIRPDALRECTLVWNNILVALRQVPYWISPYDNISRARSKIWQLGLAENLATSANVAIPEYILASPSEASLFIQAQLNAHGVCMSKPNQSGGGQSVHLIRAGDDFANAGGLPRYYQRFISGREITAFVLGEQVFPGEYVDRDGKALVDVVDIHVPAREGKVKVIRYSLPPDVAEFCRALVRALDLHSGRIDFKVDQSGCHWLLEVNETGMWDFIQRDTGQPIGKWLAHMLVHGDGWTH